MGIVFVHRNNKNHLKSVFFTTFHFLSNLGQTPVSGQINILLLVLEENLFPAAIILRYIEKIPKQVTSLAGRIFFLDDKNKKCPLGRFEIQVCLSN